MALTTNRQVRNVRNAVALTFTRTISFTRTFTFTFTRTFALTFAVALGAGCATGDFGWDVGTRADASAPRGDAASGRDRDGSGSDVVALRRDTASTPDTIGPGADAARTECTTGQSRACYSGAAATRRVGRCRDGAQMCDSAGRWLPSCEGETLPAAQDTCGNAIDDDCNGRADETCPPTPPRDQQASCIGTPVAGCGMVDVAGGTSFTLGDSMALFAGPPQPSVTVSGAMRFDAFEVSVARFRRFWDAGHPGVRDAVRYPGGMLTIRGAVSPPLTSADDAQCNWTATAAARESHPINCVDWATAQAFCAWDGGRLPTEAEWEFAARGRAVDGLAAGRLFPWGNEDPASDPTCDRAHFALCAGDDGAATRRVGSFGPTAGLYDMAGNVGEFTADTHRMYDDVGCWGGSARVDPLCDGTVGYRAVRGGSWTDLAQVLVRSASRTIGAVGNSSTGFRCVRNR